MGLIIAVENDFLVRSEELGGGGPPGFEGSMITNHVPIISTKVVGINNRDCSFSVCDVVDVRCKP